MTTILILIVILKGICLYFCWRSISLAQKKKEENPTEISNNDLRDVETSLDTLIKQNEHLTKEIQRLKSKSS